MPGNAVTIHGGKNNVIDDNIFYHCAALVYIANDLQARPEESGLAMQGFCSGNRVRNNIYQPDEAHLSYLNTTDRGYDLIKDTRIAQADYKIHFKTGGTYQIHDTFDSGKPTVIYEFEDWQKMGYDRSSIIADPMLIDPENGKFGLHPDSPAFEMEFHPLDIHRIGIRPRY